MYSAFVRSLPGASLLFPFFKFQLLEPNKSPLIFIEKFVNTESAPYMLEEMTAVDLFTVSLMLASKYLYDVDCDHGAYNSDWADVFGIDLYELNKLEIQFLSAMNWCCFVNSKDLESAVYRATGIGKSVTPSPSPNGSGLKKCDNKAVHNSNEFTALFYHLIDLPYKSCFKKTDIRIFLFSILIRPWPL
ncbi:unnamed protein product [Echinostoma caproni]|uniref:Protein CNPPD1 n=1 Tax=Echinostoma caproni TaxID=27848 RepID=A0A183AR80_9TREM|nr:unnamed protein product [Echinostoma caproni]